MSGTDKRDLRHAARERRAPPRRGAAAGASTVPGWPRLGGDRRGRAALRPRARAASPSTSRSPTSRRPAVSSSASSSRATRSSCRSCSTTSRSSGRMPPGRRRRPRHRHPAAEGCHRVRASARRWLGVDALASCDLIVTPGLSVDRHGTRLGPGRRLLRPGPALPRPGGPRRHPAPRGRAERRRPAGRRARLPVDGYVTTTGRLVRIG